MACNEPYATVQEIAQQLNIATSTARINLNKLVDLHLIDVDRAKKKIKCTSITTYSRY
ncbi:winged helix-turn-helix transcriptional regulator [Ligilactobacillus faecis]|uniref:winged helix-turn-helix transcriptional regulator n=1 Tax=Ligilactobacillus faecis TaxID=762833 RepID=UPI003461DEE6